MQQWIRAFLVVSVVGALGCQGEYRSDAKKLDRIWTAGNYEQAATFAHKEAKAEGRHRKNRVVYFLEAGRTAQAAGDYRTSAQSFDLAFVDTFPYLAEAPEATVSEAIVTTVGNDTMSRYRGTPNDRIMLHALNTLNFMAMGDMPSARVELNRSILWHDDALTRYAKAIELASKKNREQVEAEGVKWKKKAGGEAWSGSSSTVVHGNTKAVIDEHYANLPADIGDATYGNAFATHLRGVFRLARYDCDADLSGARFDLRSVAGMAPALGPHLTRDMAAADRGTAIPPTTWVYYMAGQAPELEQVKISIPLPLSGAFTMPTMALPKMVFEESTPPALQIASDTGSVSTVLLADTAHIAGAQFRQRLPIIISQEVVRATGKAVASYVAMRFAQQQQSVLALALAVGMVAYQYGSAQADLRTWHTLPSQIQVARLATPTSGRLRFSHADGAVLGEVMVVPDQCNIVVVSKPSLEAPALSIMPIQLTGDLQPWVPVFDLQPVPKEEGEMVEAAVAEPIEPAEPAKQAPAAHTPLAVVADAVVPEPADLTVEVSVAAVEPVDEPQAMIALVPAQPVSRPVSQPVALPAPTMELPTGPLVVSGFAASYARPAAVLPDLGSALRSPVRLVRRAGVFGLPDSANAGQRQVPAEMCQGGSVQVSQLALRHIGRTMAKSLGLACVQVTCAATPPSAAGAVEIRYIVFVPMGDGRGRPPLPADLLLIEPKE